MEQSPTGKDKTRLRIHQEWGCTVAFIAFLAFLAFLMWFFQPEVRKMLGLRPQHQPSIMEQFFTQ